MIEGGSAKLLFSSTMSLCRRNFIYVVVFSCAINILMLTAPIYMLQVFDRILSSRSAETLLTLFIIAIFAVSVMSALEALRSVILVRISSWLDEQLGDAVFAGQVSMALQGQASAQALRDLENVRSFISGPTIFPILDAPWTPLFLCALFFLHPYMGALASAGAVMLFALALVNEMLTRGPIGRASMMAAKANAAAEQAARNADVIEAMGMLQWVRARWRPMQNEALRLQNLASERSAQISSLSKFVRLALQIAIMSLGAYLVINNAMTPGAMIAGSILMGRALSPVEQAIGSWKTAISARSAYRRLRQHISTTEMPPDAMPLPQPTGKFEVDNIGFFHPGHEAPALNQISFKLAPGTQLGITGPTASGKTTLARIMIGNLKPKVGSARLDGVDISEWSNSDLGRYIGYVPQDVELFPGTVAENISRLAEPDAEQVVAAARLGGVHEMILRLPGGYEYEIGEAGKGLSGGQKQRIALARALYGDIKVVVLDEPNAHLDGEGEAALRLALAQLKEANVTTIIITHRPTGIDNADMMMVLKDGRIDQFGSREDVLAKILPSQGKARPQVVRGPRPA